MARQVTQNQMHEYRYKLASKRYAPRIIRRSCWGVNNLTQPDELVNGLGRGNPSMSNLIEVI